MFNAGIREMNTWYLQSPLWALAAGLALLDPPIFVYDIIDVPSAIQGGGDWSM